MCVYICVCCVCVCVSCMTRVIRWLCTYSRGREKKFLPNRIRQKSSSETIIRKRRVHGRDETPTFVPSPLYLYIILFVDPFVSKRSLTSTRSFVPTHFHLESHDEIPRNFYFIFSAERLTLVWYFFFFFHVISLAKSLLLSRMIEDCAGLIVWISRRVGRFRATSGEIAKMEASRVNSGEIGRGIAISPEPARIFPSHSEPRDPAYLK